MLSLITWGDYMNRYVLELAEHDMKRKVWVLIKKWFRNNFMPPVITKPDYTKLPKLRKGVEYMQCRIDAYNEYQKKKEENEKHSIWEESP